MVYKITLHLLEMYFLVWRGIYFDTSQENRAVKDEAPQTLAECHKTGTAVLTAAKVNCEEDRDACSNVLLSLLYR